MTERSELGSPEARRLGEEALILEHKLAWWSDIRDFTRGVGVVIGFGGMMFRWLGGTLDNKVLGAGVIGTAAAERYLGKKVRQTAQEISQSMEGGNNLYTDRIKRQVGR